MVALLQDGRPLIVEKELDDFENSTCSCDFERAPAIFALNVWVYSFGPQEISSHGYIATAARNMEAIEAVTAQHFKVDLVLNDLSVAWLLFALLIDVILLLLN